MLVALEQETVVRFNADDTLVGTLRRLAETRADAMVRLGDVGQLAVLGSRGVFGYAKRLPDEFWGAAAGDYTVGRLDLAPGIADAPGWRPFGEALWHAAFHASGGRLMQGLHDRDVIGLVYWPNATRVPITPNLLRICALLARRPTSVMLARRLLRVETAEMCRFYSAAACAGVVSVLNRRSEPATLQRTLEDDEPAADTAARPRFGAQRKQKLLDLLFAKLMGN